MALTLTENLDNLYTTTWAEMKDDVADQIFDGSPFWFWLRDKGHLKTQRGGRYLTDPVRYAKHTNVGYVGRGGSVSLDDQEHLTTTQWEWRYPYASITRFGVDDQKNSGKNQIINLMKSKLENAKDALADMLEEDLFAAQSGQSIEGLQNIVADDPTTSTAVGGINQSDNTWWRNKVKNMAGLSFAVNGVPEMRTLFNRCGTNMRQQYPDIFVSGQTPFEYYEDIVGEQKRIVNQKMGDAGFENIQFKGVPWIWSPSCAATRIYMLNTRHLWFVYDPQVYFDMTEWKPIPQQINDRAAQIITAGNLITNRRRVHGVMFGIDTE